MGRTRSEKKKAWFDQGADAFELARPTAPRLYVCPICVRGADTVDAFEFEHVPPKSVTGRALVLTCGDCNHASSQDLDPNMKAGRDLKGTAEGGRDMWTTVSAFGQTVRMKANLGPSGVILTGMPAHSNPNDLASLQVALDQAVESGATDWQFNLAFSLRYDEWLESVGWLRVAYLYLFAALGYRFVLRPELHVVREQILNPREKLVPQAMKRAAADVGGDGIMFVYSPTALRSVLVVVDTNRLFFFPGLVDASTFHERLIHFEAEEDHTLSGKRIELPRRREFAFDHDQRLGWITVPPEERPPAFRGL